MNSRRVISESGVPGDESSRRFLSSLRASFLPDKPYSVSDLCFHLPSAPRMRHPAVQEVAVVGMPDTEWGEAPQAFVVLARDASLTEAELIRHARDHMAHFKAPRKVEFVTGLPRTATGKIQKYVFKEGSDRHLRPVNVQQAVVKLTENWSLWRQCAHSFRLPVP